MNQLVSIVVPFFNEAGNLHPLREQIGAAFESLSGYDYECVFVDDCSTDGTGASLQKLAQQDARVLPIFLRENRGQSAALMAGLRAARGEFLVTLDGDLQNDPADIPAVLELLKTYDCVCGVRVNRQDTWVRKVSSRVANRVRDFVLHDGIRDTGCGLKGFRRPCVDVLVCFNGVHRFFPVFIRRAGFSIAECPVNHRSRNSGHSKYGINNRLWRGLFDLVGVAWLRKRLVIYTIAAGPSGVVASDSQSGSAELSPATLQRET